MIFLAFDLSDYVEYKIIQLEMTSFKAKIKEDGDMHGYNSEITAKDK